MVLGVQEYCDIIEESVKEAESLTCPLVDWSGIGGVEGLKRVMRNTLLLCDVHDEIRNIYLKACVRTHEENHQSIYGFVLFNIIGKKILECLDDDNSVYVLDIGCGTSQHFCNMFQGHKDLRADACIYVGIDKNDDIHVCDYDIKKDVVEMSDFATFREYTMAREKQLHQQRLCWIKDHVTHTHITMDVFSGGDIADVVDTYVQGQFDIIIVDIEPHGREWEVYQRFLANMKDEHILILKCIGNMDMFVSSFVYKFMDSVKSSSVVDIIHHSGWLWERENICIDGERDFMMCNIWPRDHVCVMRKLM